MSDVIIGTVEKIFTTALARPISFLLLICITIGTVLSVTVTIQITGIAPYVHGFRPWANTNIIAYSLAIVPAILLLLANIINNLISRRLATAFTTQNNKGDVKELRSRPTYAEEVISAVSTAKFRVYLAVHTLVPSKTDPAIFRLQKLLVDCSCSGCDVRILAPQGPDRIQAAFELRTKGIATRHLAFIEDEDLRFSVIDSDITIISTRSLQEQGQTSFALRVKSVHLTNLLASYFNAYWNHPSAMGFYEFITAEVAKLTDPSNPPTPSALLKRLRVPENEIRLAMSSIPNGQAQPVVIIIGRPGSGKSLVARLIRTLLLQEDYPFTVDIRSDYQVLHSWSRSPEYASSFEITPFDGFRVRDLTVLDSALQHMLAEITITKGHLHILEFARKQYATSLASLFSCLNKIAAVIYVNAPLEVCLSRNAHRANIRLTPDSGFVPEDIMNDYYACDDISEMHSAFGDKIIIVENATDDIKSLTTKIRKIVISHLLLINDT